MSAAGEEAHRDQARRSFLAKATEAQAVVSLLGSADRMLRDYRMAALDADALLAVLSTGVEKMLKLTYGLVIEKQDGAWPAVSVMRGYGHDVARLDRHCRELLRERLDHATWPGQVRMVLDELDADPFIGELLAILTVYGREGRFTYLDHLADGAPTSRPAVLSPLERWERYDTRVGSTEPSLIREGIHRDDEFQRLVRAPINERHRAILNRWRNAYFRALIQRVAGDEASKFGWEFNPKR